MSRPWKAARLRAVFSAALVSALTGCGSWTVSPASGPIDPPQGIDAVAEPSTASVPEPAQATGDTGGEMPLTIYVLDPHGLVAPVTIRVPAQEAAGRTALEHLVRGGPAEGKLPAGFSPVLPQGTKLSVDLARGKAAVDFSAEFAGYPAEQERKVLESVVWTLTSFPAVTSVELRIAGKTLGRMPVAGLPIPAPLTRKIGINLEKAPEADYGRTTAVTLYFRGETADRYAYFVPVTRLVPLTDDPAQAAIRELVRGPLPASPLSSSVMSDAHFLGVSVRDGVASARFDDALLGPDGRVEGETAQAIMLTLAENTGAERVQIRVDGRADLKTTDGRDLSRPVERPTRPNPVKS